MQRRTFIASLALLVSPRLAAADCMPLVHEARFATRPGAAIPPDGGVLVALTASERPRTAGDPFAGEWAMVAGTRRTRLRVVTIGPGLRRLELPRSASGALVIEGPAGRLEVTRGPELPRLEQPAIRGVRTSQTPPEGYGHVTPSVTLVRPVPEGAVAAVLRRYVGNTATPTLLGRVQRGALQVTLNEQSRCAPPMAGSLVPSVGTRVDLVYVDAFGRLSAPSGAVAFEA